VTQEDSTMRILLNATAKELDRLGGDFTHYRDWLRMSQEDLRFELVPDGARRSWQAALRKLAEKSVRTWQPAWFRRRLLLWSRFLYVPGKSAAAADLIFSHLLFPWTNQKGVPVIWNSQGISPSRYYDLYNRGQWIVEDVAWVYRKLGRKADALVIFTHSCARNVVTWCPELANKIHVAPAPIFVNAEKASTKPSLTDGVLRILFVGIDAVRKGLPEVLEAYRAVRERFEGIQIDIVSRPSQELQREIAELKDAQLHVSSPKVDVKSLMQRADIFLIPTHADTYCLAAIEAMAHGCAVIISDLEPLPEVIPDGQVGFCVPVGDAPALAEKLARLVGDKTLLRTFQENASRRFASLHAPEVVAQRLEEVSSQILHLNSGVAARALT
jgi:glycosyltransferase involved in cell wall biosynthesis